MEEPMAVTKLRTAKAANHPAVLSSPKNGDAGPTGARRDLLAAEVLDKAASLFALRGFAATSLKDVADAVGLQRSSIYYYYPNKDALLKELIQGVTLPVARIFRDVEAESLSPLAKGREVGRRLVLWVADPKTHSGSWTAAKQSFPRRLRKCTGRPNAMCCAR